MLTAKSFYLNCVDLCLSQFGINLEEKNDQYRIWIAYSGGVDSRVLLELAQIAFNDNDKVHNTSEDKINNKNTYQFQNNSRLIAVHVNHGVNKQADFWEQHCYETCKSLNINLYVEKLHLKSIETEIKQFGLEAALRKSRLAVWSKLLLPNDILFLAHHLNDQIETIIFRLLRGTGLPGLTGMKMAYILNNVKYIRPLLKNTRTEILDFAKKHKLTYIEDDSNFDLKYSRNFIRQEIVPKFHQYWPNFLYNINRAVIHLQQTDTYIDSQVQQSLLDCYVYNVHFNKNYFGKINNILSISRLLNKDKFLQHLILRKFITILKFSPPSKAQIERIYKEIINAKNDAQSKLKCGNYLLLKYRDTIHIYLEADFLQAKNNINNIKNKIGNFIFFEGECLDKISYIGHRKIKKIFQKYGIPPWYRKTYPLVFNKNKLIAIVGLWNQDLE